MAGVVGPAGATQAAAGRTSALGREVAADRVAPLPLWRVEVAQEYGTTARAQQSGALRPTVSKLLHRAETNRTPAAAQARDGAYDEAQQRAAA